MSVGTLYIGSLSDAEKIAFYNSVVEEGFNAPFDRPLETKYNQIAAVKLPKDLGLLPGQSVEKVSFGFSPPNAKAEQQINGRHSLPVTMHSIEVPIKPYTTTLHSEREDFDKDVMGILRKVPRDLKRVQSKNPDVLLGALLRAGGTTLDYTGLKSFFDTAHKCSPEGQVSATYDNLYTTTALTEANLGKVLQAQHSILASDGLTLGVRGNVLLVPPTLEHDAFVACKAAQIVYSNGTNAAPGQASNTAAMGDNVMALFLRWVKEIVVMTELQDGTSTNNTAWYAMDTNNGPVSLCYARTMEPEYVSLMNPQDPTVFFSDKYFWGSKWREGVAFGLPQFAARCTA